MPLTSTHARQLQWWRKLCEFVRALAALYFLAVAFVSIELLLLGYPGEVGKRDSISLVAQHFTHIIPSGDGLPIGGHKLLLLAFRVVNVRCL